MGWPSVRCQAQNGISNFSLRARIRRLIHRCHGCLGGVPYSVASTNGAQFRRRLPMSLARRASALVSITFKLADLVPLARIRSSHMARHSTRRTEGHGGPSLARREFEKSRVHFHSNCGLGSVSMPSCSLRSTEHSSWFLSTG
jgi:hypothetical protein